MKKLLYFIIFISVATSLMAQKNNNAAQFKIVSMDCNAIVIGNNRYVRGDIVTYNQISHWRGKECKTFKALHVGHNYVLFEYGESKSGRKLVYVKSCKNLHKSIESAQEKLTDTFYVFSDTLYVDPHHTMNENNYFIIRYNGNKYVVPMLDENVFYLKLTDYDFEFDEDNTVRLRVSLVRRDEKGNETEESVTSNMIIQKVR